MAVKTSRSSPVSTTAPCFVLVFEDQAGGWSHTNTVRLETGAEVDRLRIVTGRLTITYRLHYPVDPPCCPSRETVASYALVDGQLLGGDHRAPQGTWHLQLATLLRSRP